MFKLLLLVKRRPDLSPEAFREYYENQPVPLVRRTVG